MEIRGPPRRCQSLRHHAPVFSRPGFALTLFLRRLRYFLTRRLEQPLLTPEGFLMDTPDMLIAYWSMFVERELHAADWARALAGTDKPLVADVGANAGVFSSTRTA